ncbi:Hint domain-containing protein [Paracoccus sp. M683]|uniref:Hint domain-containing protein n=1 Tax=Paracoccus sp. M683 TaxID=2594268 RepID=UPI001180F093|nr:Hint domain-containing protein [Paracoccus sp. M683]TRW97391.1 Hint domain-containing protein [Paracoccus sp. M683]
MPKTHILQVYATRVIGGVVQADSVLTTIRIVDQDDDGIIDTKEWTDATGGVPGKLRGTIDGAPQPGLWVSTKTGNVSDGTLYTDDLYTAGTNVQPLLNTLVQNKFEVRFDDLNICFLAGTMIATPDGEKAVEDLQAGDLVLTRDHGPQPLVWVAQSEVSTARLDINPDLRPIRIAPDALGAGLPRRAVKVSGQHRILMRDATGTEVLVAARHLQAAGADGVSIVKNGKPFTLVHIACADHQIIQAEGAPMETFFPGPMAIRMLTGPARQSLLQAFPGLERGENPMRPARPFLKRNEVEALLRARKTRV